MHAEQQCRKVLHRLSSAQSHAEQQRLLAFLRENCGSGSEEFDIERFVEMADGRRTFTKYELSKFLRFKEYQGDADFVFDCLDSDCDGRVTVADIEIVHRAAELREREGLKMFRAFLKMKFASAEGAFEALSGKDLEFSDYVNFRQALSDLGFEGDAHRTFSLIKKERDGRITFSEFKAVMRTERTIHGYFIPAMRTADGSGPCSPRLSFSSFVPVKSPRASRGAEPVTRFFSPQDRPANSPRKSQYSPRATVNNGQPAKSPRKSQYSPRATINDEQPAKSPRY